MKLRKNIAMIKEYSDLLKLNTLYDFTDSVIADNVLQNRDIFVELLLKHKDNINIESLATLNVVFKEINMYFRYYHTKSFYNLSFVKDQNARVCLLFRGFCV